MLGTRFAAASEALTHERAKARMVWPAPYTARAVRNDFFARWHGREGELEVALESEMPPYQHAVAEGAFETAMILAGEAVDLIDAVVPAADLVQRIGATAEARLLEGPALLA
jgi:nitronate monooxygenase